MPSVDRRKKTEAPKREKRSDRTAVRRRKPVRKVVLKPLVAKRRRLTTKKSPHKAKSESVVHGSGESTCPICHETYQASSLPVVHGPCGHVSCASCSLRWLQKKSTRTCALCRAPVISVSHCQLLCDLLRARSGDKEPNKKAKEVIEELKKQLLDLSQGDLNHVPADYRAHIIRVLATRAIRKGDENLLEACFRAYKMRASTKMLCDVAALWQKAPGPPLALLVAGGARLDGNEVERPLSHAVYVGNIPMVRALLELRADPTKPTSNGETPLHIAVRRGRLECVKLLLSSGARVDEPDELGREPLHLAEMGLDMHQSSCLPYRQSASGRSKNPTECVRCDARTQIRRLCLQQERRPRDESARQPREIPNDAVSEDSSSNAGETESDVSDFDSYDECDDMEEDGEDGEEEDQESSGDSEAAYDEDEDDEPPEH